MKTVLITGCSSGIGKAILEKFLEQKYKVIACYRNKTKTSIKFLSSYKKKYKNRYEEFYFDLSDTENIETNLKKILIRYKKIDILINNAGVLNASPLLMTNKISIQKTFETNFFAVLKIIQLVSKKMVFHKKGVIINIGSTSGIVGDLGRSVYSASKAAIINLSKSLSKEFGPYNIRVNSISPGLIDTQMLKKNISIKNLNDLINNLPIKRLGKPSEVASVALFLASDNSSYITGQNIIIDGGLS